MALERTDIIDAATCLDGWTVLRIHQFEDWEPVDRRIEELHLKMQTYEAFLLSQRYEMRYADYPVRIELITNNPAPHEVRGLCARWGIHLLEPEDSETL